MPQIVLSKISINATFEKILYTIRRKVVYLWILRTKINNKYITAG